MNKLSVFVELERFEHYGEVPYDDDRDTVPDRTEASVGLGAFELRLQYDPEILRVAGVQEGSRLADSGRAFQCLAPDSDERGVYVFGCVSLGREPGGPQGPLTLGTVNLEVVGSGTSSLLLDAKLSGPLGDSVALSASGGLVRTASDRRESALATPAAEENGEREVSAGGGLEESASGRQIGATSTPAPLDARASGRPGSSGDAGDDEAGRSEAAAGDSGGGSRWGSVPWIAGGLGLATVAGALCLAGLLWQRHSRTRRD